MDIARCMGGLPICSIPPLQRSRNGLVPALLIESIVHFQYAPYALTDARAVLRTLQRCIPVETTHEGPVVIVSKYSGRRGRRPDRIQAGMDELLDRVSQWPELFHAESAKPAAVAA